MKSFDQEMEEEVKNFMLVWLSAFTLVSYCYYVSTKIKAGLPRLLSVLPVCTSLLLLPQFSSSMIFRSYTASLSIASVKLIQFSFDQGPLLPLPSNLFKFISFSCLPIKLQQNPKSLNCFPKWLFVKVGIFAVVLHLYDYLQYLPFPQILVLGLYPLHVYLELEILLAFLKSLVTITLGCDLEPQFNEPYVATSLQDFWGRRWNLMVTAMLRSTVYSPVRRICEFLVNSEQAMIIGVLATFIVSGVAHEILFFVITRDVPTGEVTWFFVFHGVCTVVEVLVKKKTFVGRWQVRPVVSVVATIGFVCLTGGWLFFPQLKRNCVMERRANETLLFMDFFKRKFYFPK